MMKKIMNIMAIAFAVVGVITLIWTFVSMIQLIVAGNLTIEMLKYPLLALVLLPGMPFAWSASLLWATKEMEKEEEGS